MAAADDMRRIVRRASWRPEAVLRRLWARMRASWWHGWGLMARLRRRGGGGSRQPLPVGPAYGYDRFKLL